MNPGYIAKVGEGKDSGTITNNLITGKIKMSSITDGTSNTMMVSECGSKPIGYNGFSTESNNGHIPNSLVTADNLSWVHGRHYFHFGSEWRAYQYSFIGTGDTSPNYGFNNFQTAFAPNDTNTGDPFASFLLGLPNQEQLSITSINPRLDSNYFALYIQDDFKIRRNLTLNLGLRYDFDSPRNEAHGAQSNLDLTVPNLAAGGLPGEPVLVEGVTAVVGRVEAGRRG